MKSSVLADKKEYFAIDCLKFIASYMVLGIHFMIFTDVNKELDYWTTQILCRLAVPFFFVASGYFVANKMQDVKKLAVYLKRILLTYLVYSLVYLPLMIEKYQKFDYTWKMRIEDFLYSFFITGTYFHLWYFVAIMVASVIVYVLINYVKLDDKKLLLVTGILYIIGTLGNAYRNIWVDVPFIDKVLSAYESVFETTRNGVFMGPLLLTLGYLLRKHSDKIKYRHYWLYTIIFFALMNVEEYFARAITNHAGQSMLFMTPVVAVLIFLTGSFIKVPEKLVPLGVFLRNAGVVVYAFHMFISDKYGYELSGFTGLCGFSYYLMIAKRVTILAFCIVGLSRIKWFKWLKYFY